ncbi:hypothetical protein EMCRGX_G030490 [Ephydatia muelleri]
MDRHGSVLYLALLLCSFTRVKQEGTNNTCRLSVRGNEAPQNSLIVMLEVVDPIGSSGNELVANLTTFLETCVSDDGNSCCESTSTNQSDATLHALCQLFNGSHLALYLHLGGFVNTSIAYPPPCCVLAPSAVSSSGPLICPSCSSSYSDHAGNEITMTATDGVFISTSPAYNSEVIAESFIASIVMYPSTDLAYTPQMTRDNSVSYVSMYPSAMPSSAAPQSTRDSTGVPSTSAHSSTSSVHAPQVTQDCSISSTSVHSSTSSTPVQQIIQHTSRASSVILQYSTTLDANYVSLDDHSSSTPWPPGTMLMELGNSSSGTGPLTINQIISLGAGMGAFSVLLVLLGFMVIIFWIRSEQYKKIGHHSSVSSTPSAMENEMETSTTSAMKPATTSAMEKEMETNCNSNGMTVSIRYHYSSVQNTPGFPKETTI